MTVEPGVMTIDLEPERCRSLNADSRRKGLTVRAFDLNYVIVDFAGAWPFELRGIPARLECVRPCGFVMQLRCEVDYEGPVTDAACGDVRLRLRCGPEQRVNLLRYCRELRFPALMARADVEPERVIELFERSGYLVLRGNKRRPSAAWCQPEGVGELSSDVVYVADDGALIGHVSVTRAYSRTWLGHQLTVMRGHPESFDCRVALYDHFSIVPALYDARERQFLLGYYDRRQRWHQLCFEAFVEQHGDASEAVIVRFDRFELREDDEHAVAGGRTVGRQDEVCVEQALPGELGAVVDLVHEQLPPLACAAYDIDIDRLDRAYLAPDYAACSLARGRHVFVVRERGEIVGAALCEHGSPDLSLFDVFNLAQLFLRPQASDAARRELLASVRRHYRALDCERPLVIAPPNSISLGLDRVETMGCVIWSGCVLPVYRRYLADCFERVRPRTHSNKASQRA